jgi:hypothetical protein
VIKILKRRIKELKIIIKNQLIFLQQKLNIIKINYNQKLIDKISYKMRAAQYKFSDAVK